MDRLNDWIEEYEGELMTEAEHQGQHDFHRDGKWQKCHGCDYLEPVAMISIEED